MYIGQKELVHRDEVEMSAAEGELVGEAPNTNTTPPVSEIFNISRDKFLTKIKNAPMSKIIFFTFKDNSGKYDKMDRVRKWVSRWASHYLIVRSPEGGIHFHGLGLVNGMSIRHLKGIHLHITPLGDAKKEQLLVEHLPTHPSHPLINDYKVSVRFMCVMRELREQFGGPKSSIMDRIKSRKHRERKKLNVNAHVGRVVEYLRKNFYEGEGVPYDDIICK